MTARVLVVDDILPNVKVLEAKLAAEYYDVTTALSGKEALEEMAKAPPDIVLLDVMMPGMDGPTTLGKLREIAALEKTPAIFLTAKAMPAEIEHYQSLGALGVIVKPFNPTSICQEIETLWDAFHSS